MRRLLLWLALVTLACALPGTPASSPAPSPPSPALGTPAAPAASETTAFSGEAVADAAQNLPEGNPFAPFPALARNAPTMGPARVAGGLPKLDSVASLGAAQQEALLTHGFVIGPRPFDSFAAAYAYGGEQKLPAFITVDAVLDATRVVLDVAWQRSEARHTPADLRGLCHSMAATSQAQWEAAQDDQTLQAALRNMGIFAVCSSLLDEEYAPPAPVAALTAEELTLIDEGGRFLSPLFGREESYAPFAPSGHYAQDEALARAFRALTWLARPLSLDYDAGGGAGLARLQEARLAARQALLMAWGLQTSDNLSRWERLFQPGLYVYGARRGVAWSVPQVLAAADAVYGDTASAGALGDVARLDDFLATIHTLPPSLPFEPAPQPAFALLQAPGGAAPDDAILRDLVFNRVGAYTGEDPAPRTAIQTDIGLIRGLPRTLDVAAALGSPLAGAIVARDGDAAYEGYDLQMTLLQEHFAALEPGAWTTTLNGAWLYALQPLLAPVPQEGVLFAPAQSWQARRLFAWHGGWMALRQETSLAPRPVAAVAVSPDVAAGYLEPQPQLYARLAALTSQMLDGLSSRELLTAESEDRLRQLRRLLDAAQEIARKEVAGERLTTDEAYLLSQFMSRLRSLTTYEPAAGASGGAAAAQTASSLLQVIDVAQEAGSGSLLQAASGEAWPIYVLAPREDGLILTMGAVMSNYELHGEQVGAGAWRRLEDRPPPPAWLQEFVVAE